MNLSSQSVYEVLELLVERQWNVALPFFVCTCRYLLSFFFVGILNKFLKSCLDSTLTDVSRKDENVRRV